MFPTNVPPAFVWRDADPLNAVVNQAHGVKGVAPPSGQEIVVMWWEADCDTFCLKQYPGSGEIAACWILCCASESAACWILCCASDQIISFVDVAVLYNWRGEDSGPNVNSAADVLKLYALARQAFPNATVRAAGMDDVTQSLLRSNVRDKLPVLDLEVGDSW
eukprot:SAG31_NODE_2838_length_5017_cov_3.102074_3_plen_163_part_00